MLIKRLLPALAIVVLLAVTSAFIVGANQTTAVRVPPGPIVESPNAMTNQGVQKPHAPEAPALPAPKSSVLFSDAFTKGLDAWQSPSTAFGEWVTQDGYLQQNGNAEGAVADDSTLLSTKDTRFDNVVIEAEVYPMSGSPVGVVFRGSNHGYYRVSLYSNLPNQTYKAALERVVGDQVEKIATAPVTTWPGYSRDKWQLITVIATGNHISVLIDELPIIEVSDSTYTSGWIGVWTAADRGALFDNVRVQRTLSNR